MSVLSGTSDRRKDNLETVYSSNSRLSLLNKRKKANNLYGMSNQSLNGSGDKFVSQRVLSAKTHRVKQLQNQLADAHFHLQELTNENKVLRAMQKKHEIALQRYESSNAELPTVLNSHSEEMRIQQTKFKQLKQQFKEVTQKLKERDIQLQQLKTEHQHLMELSKEKNLPEREKLQSLVSELTTKVQQQEDIITNLQRRLALEAKNFKHQLQMEMNKHKDTRHDLNLAISNADKLSTIIEMKEKMLNQPAAYKSSKPPMTKQSFQKKTKNDKIADEKGDQSALERLGVEHRDYSLALAREEEISATIEPKSRFIKSRTSNVSVRSAQINSRKVSRDSEDLNDIARTVKDGINNLSMLNEDIDFHNSNPDEIEKTMEHMKADLLNKIKNNEEPMSRKSSALRRMSTEDSIEEEDDSELEFPKNISMFQTENSTSKETEKPKSRGKLTSFPEQRYDDEYTKAADFKRQASADVIRMKREVSNDNIKPKRETSALEKKLDKWKSGGKDVDNYCKKIMSDIDNTAKLIDKHVKVFGQSKLDSDKLTQQINVVDKMNEFVTKTGEIPDEVFLELNNNFKAITDHVMSDTLPVRNRAISGKRERSASKVNPFGDSTMSNQDLLNDLLGKN